MAAKEATSSNFKELTVRKRMTLLLLTEKMRTALLPRNQPLQPQPEL